jgi:hypothetical protein
MAGPHSPGAPRGLPRTVLAALFASGSLRYLFVLIALIAAGAGAYYGLSPILKPWAHSYSGRPLLVGYWQGETVFGPGDVHRVALHLTDRTRRAQTIDIIGAATLCGPKGKTHYSVNGNTQNRQGTRFTLEFWSDSLAPGTHLGETEGTWDGADRLELRAQLYTAVPEGGARGGASTGARRRRSDDPTGATRFGLRRSTEEAFGAACGEAP